MLKAYTEQMERDFRAALQGDIQFITSIDRPMIQY